MDMSKKHLVLQSDFGLSDGAVSAMHGVALSVDPTLGVYNLTHDIPQFNIWDGSYRLFQTINYWPEGTVIVSVVDPGVGTDRLSIIARTTNDRYVVTPDNGTLTHVKEKVGIAEVRIIDEEKHRLPGSGESYTFHGRDIYAYTGARLAAGVISYEQVGPSLDVKEIVTLPITQPSLTEDDGVIGTIDILDVRFGNLWTNISRETFKQLGVKYGDVLEVTIANNHRLIYKNIMKFGRSFADSRLGEPIIFVNSLDNIGLAINQGSFAKAYRIETGANWKITIRKT